MMNGNLVKLNHLVYNLELLKDDIEAKVVELNRVLSQTKQITASVLRDAERTVNATPNQLPVQTGGSVSGDEEGYTQLQTPGKPSGE